MMYIHMTFSKKNHSTPLHSTPLHSTHSTELFKIFFSLLTLSTAFLQKASGPEKNILLESVTYVDTKNTANVNTVIVECQVEVQNVVQHRLRYQYNLISLH